MSTAGNVGEQHVTGEAQPRPPHIFISYSHDSPEHKARVRALAQRLLALMNKHYPTWREARAELNELPLSLAFQVVRFYSTHLSPLFFRNH